MAVPRPLSSLLPTLLPAFQSPIRPVVNLPLLQRLQQQFRILPVAFGSLALPNLPSLPSISEIWESVLRAVPKKKTSYRKKRQRFLAGKGLKDVTSLNKCSGCGRVKRAHLLCPYCLYCESDNHLILNWTGTNSPKPSKKISLNPLRRLRHQNLPQNEATHRQDCPITIASRAVGPESFIVHYFWGSEIRRGVIQGYLYE